MYLSIRVLVCLLSCSFKSIGTLIFIFAVTGTGVLATAFLKTSIIHYSDQVFHRN